MNILSDRCKNIYIDSLYYLSLDEVTVIAISAKMVVKFSLWILRMASFFFLSMITSLKITPMLFKSFKYAIKAFKGKS